MPLNLKGFMDTTSNMRSSTPRVPPKVSALAALALTIALPQLAAADVVTGTITPASAKVVIINAAGETVAQPKAGAYQLQLPVGKYKAKCQAPKAKDIDVLVLSEPVTVNIDCT
jgi:hypothetical protein